MIFKSLFKFVQFSTKDTCKEAYNQPSIFTLSLCFLGFETHLGNVSLFISNLFKYGCHIVFDLRFVDLADERIVVSEVLKRHVDDTETRQN